MTEPRKTITLFSKFPKLDAYQRHANVPSPERSRHRGEIPITVVSRAAVEALVASINARPVDVAS